MENEKYHVTPDDIAKAEVMMSPEQENATIWRQAERNGVRWSGGCGSNPFGFTIHELGCSPRVAKTNV